MCSVFFFPRFFLASFFFLFFIFLNSIALPNLRATDGSGLVSVSPDSVLVEMESPHFTFTYTAEENMQDAQVSLVFPEPWENPNFENITLLSGLVSDVFDDLDNPNLDPSAWHYADALGGLLTSLDVNNLDPIQGDGSLSLDILLGLGLGDPTVYYNSSIPLDWSNYTHLAFWIRQSSALGLSAGDVSLQVAESGDLASAIDYHLDDAMLDLNLFEGGDWAYVVIDLSNHPSASRDAVLSFGLRLSNVSVDALASLDLDHIVLGPGSPVFDDNEVLFNILDLGMGGDLTFDYQPDSSPSVSGSYEFDFASRMDPSGTLASLINPSPLIEVIDLEEQAEGLVRQREIDGDGSQEFAIALAESACFDLYVDPDQSSVACFSIQASLDNCPDHFIDIDGDGCVVCPDVFWDATNDVVSNLRQTTLDLDGDGLSEEVCAYDSDGDGQEDSFIAIDDTEGGVAGGPSVGGEGIGEENPFFMFGSGGCRLDVSFSSSWGGISLLYWFFIGLFAFRLSKKNN